jgi:hypothetical protein
MASYNQQLLATRQTFPGFQQYNPFIQWTLEEDTQLTSAVANTSKKKWGNKYKIDWDSISVLVPGRSKNQCYGRWRKALDPNVDRVNEREGKWAEDEEINLKVAVQAHDGKNWEKIATLVPGRTKVQCHLKWRENNRRQKEKRLDSMASYNQQLLATRQTFPGFQQYNYNPFVQSAENQQYQQPPNGQNFQGEAVGGGGGFSWQQLQMIQHLIQSGGLGGGGASEFNMGAAQGSNMGGGPS